jgi:hypothetical protein
MEALLKQLEETNNWKNYIKTQCRRNGVDVSLANAFTILKMRKFFIKSSLPESSSDLTQISAKQRIKSAVWL